MYSYSVYVVSRILFPFGLIPLLALLSMLHNTNFKINIKEIFLSFGSFIPNNFAALWSVKYYQ